MRRLKILAIDDNTVNLATIEQELKGKLSFQVEHDFEWLFLGQHYGLLTPLFNKFKLSIE